MSEFLDLHKETYRKVSYSMFVFSLLNLIKMKL